MKAENDESESFPEWASLIFDYRQIHGFDLGAFGPIHSPAAADMNSGERPSVESEGPSRESL